MIGNLLNQYRLDEVIGQGGMGVVYRAQDMNLERVVAVKVLSSTLRDDPEFVARFRQEARIQAGLNHPNIATLFDFFVWNDMPVAVMEFIKGETFRSRVDRTGAIPAHIALPMFVQALRGVAAGHKRGIIHRDLKPSNIMITEDGVVKITDFGIAKVRNNSGQTRVSTRVGSASYMAPEQILGRPVDEKTDIYIMGGTLYELLTGRPPFQGLSQFEIDSAHVRESPKPPTQYCADIPQAAVDAVMRALAKEPADRFATAEDFIQALPDLHGVPYVAPVIQDDDATRHGPAPTAIRDAAPTQYNPAQYGNAPPPLDARAAGAPLVDATLYREAPAADVTLLQPAASTGSGGGRLRGVLTAVGVSGSLGLLVVGVVLFWGKQSHVSAVHPAAPPSSTAPASTESPSTPPADSPPVSTSAASSPPAESPPASTLAAANSPPGGSPPASTPSASTSTPPAANAKPTEPITPPAASNLTGTWSSTYADGSGKPKLTLTNLRLQQADNGAVTGHFILDAGGECTLEKSAYSAGSRHLRLIIHCHNPDHPKYLNVPLEFNNVDPTAATIPGGRLAFHLADEIAVTLKRAPGT